MSTELIAKTMKIARESTGHSQKQVADMLGISYQAISNYERGLNRIDSATLNKLCSIYKLDITTVLSVVEWHHSFIEDFQHARSDDERRMIISEYGAPCPELIYEYQAFILQDKPAAESDGLDELSPMQRELFVMLKKLTPEQLEAVVAVIKQMLRERE